MGQDRRETLLEGLPAALRERIRPLDGRAPHADGELVLCWLHHAMRADENPALETAVAMANALGLPALVYAGLGGAHRYHADRHHAFILEGAREAQAAIRARGLAFAFHLPARPGASSPLPDLARRAALVVTEDYPAPPFPAWNRRLAAAGPAPVWRVDSACVLPMRRVEGRHDRAYAFRAATEGPRAARIARGWMETAPERPPFAGELGFPSLDLARADLPELVAGCDIDHGLPPVADTPGGAAAGLRRWARFRDGGGLSAYARRRNDALDRDGTSRMSPYLHQGQVSPFRLARDAAARGGEGPRKFLDELLVWRELAFHFCQRCPDPEAWSALPSWARASLEAHAADPRPRVLDWETLARGRTGDPVWDVAQRSLLRRGELHNNLRMTWGKQLLSWTAHPRDALRLLIDLNHRFALDGNDPASYGGLLWCLGLFDRPFSPERPIVGAVRTRSTEGHARRLDPARLAERAAAPAAGPPLDLAVVGAGLAGLMAARTLADQGHRVRVLDKGRGPGGRSATRRHEGWRFDHGAQYLTLRDPRLAPYREAWLERGLLARWEARVLALAPGRPPRETSETPRYVALPGMSGLAGHLAADLELLRGRRVAAARRGATGDGYFLEDEAGTSLGRCDLLLVTAPPPQAAALLAEPAPALAERLAAVTMQPCWALMVVFDPPLAPGLDAAFVEGGPLAWLANNGSKPGRPPAEAWTLHASPDWSASALEWPAERVSERLLEAFFEALDVPPRAPLFQRAHRWRYARPAPDAVLGEDALWDPTSRVGFAGDAGREGRAEAALLSGAALAGRVLTWATERARAGEPPGGLRPARGGPS